MITLIETLTRLIYMYICMHIYSIEAIITIPYRIKTYSMRVILFNDFLLSTCSVLI